MGHHMKIPPTKYDVPPTKYDYPLPFKKRNRGGQHIISCEDPPFLNGSSPKIQDLPFQMYLPYGKRVY